MYKSTKIDKAPDNNIEKNESHKIYALMARISLNVEIPRRNFGDSLQLTNWILESGVTCHMTSEFSDSYRGHWWKQINTLKLQMFISSHQNKQGKSK